MSTVRIAVEIEAGPLVIEASNMGGKILATIGCAATATNSVTMNIVALDIGYRKE